MHTPHHYSNGCSATNYRNVLYEAHREFNPSEQETNVESGGAHLKTTAEMIIICISKLHLCKFTAKFMCMEWSNKRQRYLPLL